MMTMKTKIVVPTFAGVDVGAETLVLVIRRNEVAMKAQRFANTAADRQRLVKKLAKFPDIRVCLEATGVYYLDLAIALHDAGIRVMVLNPKAAHNFAKVLLKHSLYRRRGCRHPGAVRRADAVSAVGASHQLGACAARFCPPTPCAH